jgi:UDP-N-acetyl-2-amino-2-deoxyglucuronate dehydrogenase
LSDAGLERVRKMGIKFAILGTGMVSHIHAEAIRSLADAELTCVYSRNEETGKPFASQYNCRLYTNVQEVLACSDVDAVSICTPSGTHADLAILAARHQKHVLAEKPLDISLEKADRAIEAARENNVKLGVIFQLRFMQEVIRAKQFIASGVLGKLIQADSYMKFYRPETYYRGSSWKGTKRLDGGGALMNQGIHGIDLLLWLAGPVQSVMAQVLTLRHDIEAEDTAAAILRFRNGAMGVIQGTTSIYPDRPQSLLFHGERGTLELAGTEAPYIRQLSVQDRPDLAIQKDAVPDDLLGEAHKNQYVDFIQAIEGNREPAVNGEEGRKALELVSAIYRSSEQKRIVQFV